MKVSPIYLFIGALCFLAACKSKQKTNPVVTTELQKCNLNADSIASLFPLLDSSNTTLLKLKGDIDAELDSNKIGLAIQLRIKTNDTIWVSLSKASFPVIKLLATKDSVKLLDLFNKKYLVTNYEGLAVRTGVNLNFVSLQNALLGQYIPFSDSTIYSAKNGEFMASNSPSEVMLKASNADSIELATIGQERKLLWAQWLNCDTKNLVRQFLVLPNQGSKLWVQASEPDTLANLTIPKNINIEAKKYLQDKLKLNVNYKRLKSPKKMSFPFKVPEDYEKLEDK